MIEKKAVDFLNKYSGRFYDPLQAIPAFKKHNEYKTAIILEDKKGIYAFCIFNIDGQTANISELTIRPDYRKIGLIRYITAIGWSRFPYLKYVLWERRKNPYKPITVFKITDLLGKTKNLKE